MNEELSGPQPPSVPRATLQVIGILLATAAALWVVFRIRGVILLLVLAIFFAYLISPLISLARRPIVIRGRPRALPLPAAIAVVYLLIFGALALAVWLFFPMAASQFSELANEGPRYAAGVRSWFASVQTYERSHFPRELQTAINGGIERALAAAAEAIERGFLPFLAAVAGFVPWLVLVPILALFLLKDADAFRRSLLRLAPTARMRWRGKDFFEDVNAALAAYIRAQLVACLIVGAACTAGFAVIGVPYALVLGIAAGLLEFIPLAGPVTIGAVAVFLAAFRSGGQAVTTLAFLIVLRIVEDYVVYPRIIGRGIHLHPLAIIFAILCGAELGGLAGIFFSIPVVAVVSVAVRHWREHRAEEVVVAPGLAAMSEFLRDLRFAVRALRKSPGFTAVALATLTLGIGANTAIFSVVDAVLLRPMPYSEPDRIVAVFQTQPSQNELQNGISWLNYADLAGRSRSFEAVGAIRMHDFTLTSRGDPALVVALTVTSSIFPVFRVRPLLGRGLEAGDDPLGAPPVALLGERLWRERFGGDPAVLGTSVVLDDSPFTIVGVMADSLRPPPTSVRPDLWVPLTHDPVFPDLRQRRGGHYLRIVGRLKKGVALQSAESELSTIQAALAEQFPKENGGWGVRVVPFADSLVGGVRTALLVLLGAVALVFLIACANVANLLLVRSGARIREVAIRTALGASRSRLIRLLLTECLVLGLAGGALGTAAGFAGVRALRAWLPADLPRANEIALDARVLLFAFAASIVSAAIFGLAPALQASGVDLTESLKEGSAGSGEGAARRRVRDLLVIGETAFSFILLIGAGLLGRSFVRLQHVDPGFEAAGILTAGMSLPRTKYSKPEQWLAFYEQLVGGLKSEPGVDSVTAALPVPLTGSGLNFAFQVEGRPALEPGADQSANYTAATGDYFRVLGVRLLAGRLLDARDARGRPNVCLISAAFARQQFAGENPLGKRLRFGFTEPISREIVGVVSDVKRDGLGAPSKPEMYVPFEQDPWWAAYVALRVKPGRDPLALAAAVRRQVRALDPEMPIADIQPYTQTVAESVAQPRFRTTLLGLFGATALLLAVVGIYGVISYTVGRRTREVGIRLTLGASPGDVLRLILAQGIGLTAVGLVCGAAGAILLTRSLSSLLFEVSPLDLPTWTAVAATLLAAGLAACWVPARRAMRVDPVRALRHE